MKLSNNTILITGGSKGIGLALAKRFADLENKVIIVGRNEIDLKSAEEYNPNIKGIKCDLTDEHDFDWMLLELENNHSELNILINNAAVQYNYSFLNESLLGNKIENEITTNLTIPVKLSARLIPLLANNNNSAIVNISSALAFAPKESAPVYCSTKAAIHSFSISLRYQLEPTGIKVFEMIPPLVKTNMTSGRGKDKMEPQKVVEIFINNFEKKNYEINIGKTKLVRFIYRIYPKLAYKILRKS